MAKLFVSYSRKDSAAARKLINSFKEMGQDVWVDWEDIPPAVDWMDQIFHGIEGADAFLFLLSPDSAVSDVCNVEVGHAAKNNKRIIPILVREVDRKAIKVNPVIGDLNWTKIREEDDYKAGLALVKTAIEQDIEWVEEHSRLQVRAIEWHIKRENSLLLRGNDMRRARQAVAVAEEKKKNPEPTPLQKEFILRSARHERRTILLWAAITAVALVMAVISLYAIEQRNNAVDFAREARTNAMEAKKNEADAIVSANLAQENARQAEVARDQAEKAQKDAEKARDEAQAQRLIAEAKTSAAKAQIYQARPGELYTSTLLAIDSWLKAPSADVEDILRRNISLLPAPVTQVQRNGAINALEFNATGDAFVTASADGSVCAWKVEDGTPLFCATSPGSVTDATFSPNGKTVVSGDDTGMVQVIDLESGNVKSLDFNVPVWDVNVSPNGKTIAAARDDGLVTLITLQTAKESFSLRTFGRLLVSAFSQNGEWIAAGSSAGNVTIWELESSKIIPSSPHKAEVSVVAFSPNSRLLATGGKDNIAFVFDPNAPKQLRRIVNEDWVTDIAFSPDSARLVTVSNDQRIRVWDLTSGEERLRMLQDGLINDVQVSGNGQWIATTGSDKNVHIWNAFTGAETLRIPLRAGGTVIGFGGNGKYLVSGDESGEVSIWDISGVFISDSYVQFNGVLSAAQYNATGDAIVASDDNRLWVLDPNAFSPLTPRPPGKPVREMKGAITHLALSPDSTRIAVSTSLNELLIYNLRNKTSVNIKYEGIVTSLAFTADSAQLLTGDTKGALQFWDVLTGKPASPALETGSAIFSLASSNGLTLVGALDKITLYDPATRQPADGEIEWLGENRVLAASPDGSLLAASNVSDQIKVWRSDSGKYTLLQVVVKEPAYSLAFNAQGTILAIGGAKTIYLIDPRTGSEINRIPQANIVTNLSFAGGTNNLLSASSNILQVWDIDSLQKIETSRIVETSCSRLIRNFDAAQRAAFFGDENYPPLCMGLP